MNNSVAIRELKNSLSRYLKMVKSGQTILVTDRSRPVAQIIPISGAALLDTDWQELIAAGSVRIPALESLAEDYFADLLQSDDEHQPLPDGVTINAVISEREESAR